MSCEIICRNISLMVVPLLWLPFFSIFLYFLHPCYPSFSLSSPSFSLTSSAFSLSSVSASFSSYHLNHGCRSSGAMEHRPGRNTTHKRSARRSLSQESLARGAPAQRKFSTRRTSANCALTRAQRTVASSYSNYSAGYLKSVSKAKRRASLR